MSFIVVKYGKEQEKLFNTNCKVINLLYCIKETCGCKDTEVDLAEEGTGILQFLPSNLHEHSSSLLITPKTSYVLVKVQKGEDGSMEYLPMIDMSKSNFLVKLRSTRTKVDPRKRPNDKKSREDNDVPTFASAGSGGLTSSPSFSSNISVIPNTTSSPSSSSSPSSTSGTNAPPAPNTTTTPNAAPASTTTTPTKGKTPTKSRKPMFPKIEGAIAPDATNTPAASSPSTPVVASDDATLVTTSPITPSKKKSHRKPSSSIDPVA